MRLPCSLTFLCKDEVPLPYTTIVAVKGLKLPETWLEVSSRVTSYGNKVVLPAFTEKRNRDWHYRDVVQLARTPALGAGGRTFESYHPDEKGNTQQFLGNSY